MEKSSRPDLSNVPFLLILKIRLNFRLKREKINKILMKRNWKMMKRERMSRMMKKRLNRKKKSKKLNKKMSNRNKKKSQSQRNNNRRKMGSTIIRSNQNR